MDPSVITSSPNLNTDHRFTFGSTFGFGFDLGMGLGGKHLHIELLPLLLKGLLLFGLLSLLLLLTVQPCWASSAGSNSSLPFEAWLAVVQKSLSGPVAFSISLIGMVTCGAVLILSGGEIGSFVRTLIFIVLVMTLLVGANALMSGLFNGASIGNVTPPQAAVSQVVDTTTAPAMKISALDSSNAAKTASKSKSNSESNSESVFSAHEDALFIVIYNGATIEMQSGLQSGLPPNMPAEMHLETPAEAISVYDLVDQSTINHSTLNSVFDVSPYDTTSYIYITLNAENELCLP